MFGDGFERSTILRAPYGASGPKACEHQSRHQEKYHYGAGYGGEAKKTASAPRTSKAPVVSRAYREVLFDGVSRPSRCGAAGLCRWLLDQVTRPSRRTTLVAEARSTRSSRSRNANLSGSVQSPLRIQVGLLDSQPWRLPDETLFLRIGSRHEKRHSFTRLKSSIGRLHAKGPDEDSSTLNSEKDPKTGYFTSYRTNSPRGSCGRVARPIRDLVYHVRVSPNQAFPLRRLHAGLAGVRMLSGGWNLTAYSVLERCPLPRSRTSTVTFFLPKRFASASLAM